jgi:phage gpG-like protein
MINLSVRTSGFEAIRKKMTDASKRAQNNVDFSDYVAARAYKEAMKNFDEEKGPDGRWASLSPQTIARRRKGKGSGSDKILQDTTRMKQSIIYSASKNIARVICNMAYGIIHQDGIKVPQRKFLWVEDDFLKAMSEKYAKFIKGDISQ